MQVTTTSTTQLKCFCLSFLKRCNGENVSKHGFKSGRLLKNTPIADNLTCYVISPGQLDDFYSKYHNKSHLPQVSNSLQPVYIFLVELAVKVVKTELSIIFSIDQQINHFFHCVYCLIY